MVLPKVNSKLDGLIFNNAIFYVMSGTGNTYRMAYRMKEIANPYMEDIKIVMIDKADAENEPTHSQGHPSGGIVSYARVYAARVYDQVFAKDAQTKRDSGPVCGHPRRA